MPEYQSLTDDEVLQIATEREQLTDDARSMLDSELALRKLSIKDVQSQKIAYERAEKLERARLGHKILSQRTFSRRGFGINFFGKTNVRRDPAGHFEEYDATQCRNFMDSGFSRRSLHCPQNSLSMARTHL